ncbi:MAG: uracil-DNA glycosylase [Syntrophomonadaceae bacterium]|nr:uracil-DNA glycosylase [Syntrophomonadaceae bacterium]MDD3271559.1 uracil-DNA glycosylase [Syntrophomonadaceae bacterium]MDD3898375.1 uracil-DNA glycosylase [Syntrophomonadaceae bacterium]MDD4561686.1 uracil-DNA glycosylase [Syntrophomonadaceae bacterium]
MSIEQPGLFGLSETKKLESPEEGREEQSLAYIPFIPGVKPQEAYLELNSLSQLEQRAKSCRQCRLREGCRQVVFGEGNSDARLMLVGEGPGMDEDLQGRPFVGKAGQLLDKILQAAELPRQEVYIGNVVKCRPPGNRLPHPDEVRVCRNYLEAQIRIIKPRILVCLGSLATKAIIDPQVSITMTRGKWFNRQGISIMAVFHPAALLRNPSYKRPTWEDFKQIRDKYYR